MSNSVSAAREYSYELVVTEEEVVSEKNISDSKEEVGNNCQETGDRFTTCNAEFKRLKSMKLRKNVSLISHARQHEYNELSDIYSFFREFSTNVSFGGLHTELFTDESMSKIPRCESYFSGLRQILHLRMRHWR
jgi:hypothetical protein